MHFLFLLLCVFSFVSSVCVNEEYVCNQGGIDYAQANRRDCSRFIHCAFGKPTYFQCTKNFVFDFCMQKCVRVVSNGSRYECFNATNVDCVVQRERPYDPAQLESELTSDNQPSLKTDPPPIPQVPIISDVLPGGPLQPPFPISPLNPYTYGSGLGLGGLGFNVNLNYNPLAGWGVNSNLGLQVPWSLFLPFGGFPSPTLSFNSGIYSPFGSPYGFRKKRSTSPGRTNAVRVTSCVPTDPWPDSSTAINDTTKR